MDESNLNNGPHRAIVSLIESGSVKVVHMARFLPRQERDVLYTAVCKEQEAFQTLALPGAKEEPTKFLSMESDGKINLKVDLVQEAAKMLTKRMMKQLPFLCKTLDIEPFEVSDIPTTFINGLHGHYADPHADSTNGQYRISILYYFHKVPKVFRGGNLNLYAFDDEAQHGYSEKILFQIELEDNLLIAFPSQTFHGVTEVQSDSADFVDGRFVAVGFLGA